MKTKFETKSVRLYTFMMGTVFVVLVMGFYVVSHEEEHVNSNVINTTNPEVVLADGFSASYPSDFSDDRNLMGVSHDVFVGKVISEVGTEGWYTKFAVQVIDDIKGNLGGVVSIGVTGGYQNGIFYVAKGSAWLAPGSTYLLAVRYRSIDDSYRLIDYDYPVSWKLLSEDSTLTTATLRAIAQNDPRVRQFKEAYPNEILDAADTHNHETFNSYIAIHSLTLAPALPSIPTSTQYLIAPHSAPIIPTSSNLSSATTSSIAVATSTSVSMSSTAATSPDQ